MKNNLYIYHHLGLGDHFMCNAIVRIKAKTYEKIFLFVKPKYLQHISYMYRDLQNIKFIAMDDSEVRSFMQFNNNNYLIIGHTPEYFKKIKTGIHFDEGFYNMVEIPLENKWDNFYFERDIEKEKHAFYNLINLKDDEEFIVVHDDPKNNRNFKSEYIPKNIKIINPNNFPEVGIFDFLYTFEKAKELHLMNSSFLNLIDCIQLQTNKLILHSYARKDMGDNPNPKLKLNWTILY